MPWEIDTFFSICSFFLWHAWKRGPGFICKFDWTHGSKNRRINFGNCVRAIILIYDLLRSSNQSHVGQGSRVGTGLRYLIAAINCAPVFFRAHPRKTFLFPSWHFISLLLYISQNARYIWMKDGVSLWMIVHGK